LPIGQADAQQLEESICLSCKCMFETTTYNIYVYILYRGYWTVARRYGFYVFDTEYTKEMNVWNQCLHVNRIKICPDLHKLQL
jgi:hypothetical protein